MSWDSIFRPIEAKYDHFVVKDVAKLPDLPKDIMKWIDYARPIVDGQTRVILPMWEQIYRDNYPFKFILGGRQIFKSTYTTDILAFETTAFKGVQVGYVTYDDISRSGFAKQRLQYGTFEPNPILKMFPRHRLGSVNEISLKNMSTIYTFIDHNHYSQVEGKSLSHTLLDEAQYQDIENVDRVILAMTTTQGKLSVLGVGGESGSAYEKLWKTTDQRYWVFDDEYWREKLQFGYIEAKAKWGFIWGDYLRDVMKGHWEIPDHARGNTMFHGYHLPATIFPHIPLFIADAMDPTKYNVHPRFSIEYKQVNLSPELYESHVIGGFFIAERRPITAEMVEACMKDTPWLKLLTPIEIAELKHKWGDRIKISLGVDWGSGSPSHTVITIVIEWLGKEDGNPNIYQLVYFDKRPKENQMQQAEDILKLFNEANCDIGVADIGYGANQVKFIQDGGHSIATGELIEGLGTRKFIGCVTASRPNKPLELKDKKIDQHGTELKEYTIDQASKIQDFVNLLDSRVSHTLYADTAIPINTKFMIPPRPSGSYRPESLVDDLCSLTRKDLDKLLEKNESEPDKRTFAKKEFNHPKDSLMSLVYAFVGFEKRKTTWFSSA